jgi:hypothetical protein
MTREDIENHYSRHYGLYRTSSITDTITRMYQIITHLQNRGFERSPGFDSGHTLAFVKPGHYIFFRVSTVQVVARYTASLLFVARCEFDDMNGADCSNVNAIFQFIMDRTTTAVDRREIKSALEMD